MIDLNILISSIKTITVGVPITILLVFLSCFIGFFIAIGVNIVRNVSIVSVFTRFYVFLFRGTPLILQIYIMYYGLGVVASSSDIENTIVKAIFEEPMFYAVIALALNTGAYLSAIMKTCVEMIDKGQIVAARSFGFTNYQIYTRVIIPQAIKSFIPMYGNEIIMVVKASSLASVITIMEITGYMNYIRSSTYSFYEPCLVAGFYYFVFNYSLTGLANRFIKKYNF